ncbi:hypothetical protein C8F01DRAFT_1057798 [Mycena amicta]|nr:hypothetical protein C8F01DRAFT_1057798 [Mycena amicta]
MRGLPLDDQPPRSRIKRTVLPLLLLATAAVAAFFIHAQTGSSRTLYRDSGSQRDFQLPIHCPAQPSALTTPLTFLPTLEVKATDKAKDKFIERLRGAVRIPTETFDGAPSDGGDGWYDKFYAFEEYLRATFPDVFAALKVEQVATHGLLLTWQGSDSSLQPLVLMAHQDTVPVPLETVSRWTHPPFDAHLDDEGWIWGRGAADCKNLLIAELTAVSELLHAGFKPTRTVHVAFGFDEEGGGVRSAGYISAHLEDLYGRDSLFLVVDEGGLIQPPSSPSSPLFITPSLGEKGSVNIRLSVNVPGGHSSVPPAHTAIGILSALVTTLEGNPPEVVLSKGNPFAGYLLCKGEHDPTSLDPTLLRLLSHERTWPAAARWLAERSLTDAARLSTTQAVDIVGGGVKVNALPEEAHVVVNHRVSVDDSIARLEERYISLLSPVAEEFGLAVVGFGESAPPDTAQYLQLSHPGFGAEASPVTPAEGDAWSVFAGTAKHLYPSAVVAPFLSTGGTDTRAFVNLTRAIYRFQAVREDQRANAHTVDERIHVDAHLSSIEFVHALVQNVDGWR